jgi:sulfoxide reductase heme-binding subunit YedZ
MEMHARSTRIGSLTRPEPAGGWPVAALAGATLLVGALVAGAAMTGRSTSPVTWYLARASRMTLYLLLWFSTVLGLGLTTALFDRFGDRGIVYSLHRFVTSLAYGFLSLHVLSLAADSWIAFGPGALVVPFSSSWREPWTEFGVIAGGLYVVIGGSFALRRYLGYRGWRALHWLAFPLYGLGLAHGVGAGTDSGTIWGRGIYWITGLAVVWLVTYRACKGRSRMRPPDIASPPPPRFDRFAALPQGCVGNAASGTRLQRPSSPAVPL